MSAGGPVFGIVAGEVSGDTLGAGLITALRERFPTARFVGICGPQMLAAGGDTLAPMERLSVMGLVEVLGRIKELFALRDQLLDEFAAQSIDIFIGIDAPDFNLRVEAALKQRGVPTVHYVSPSVWAWRQGRVKTIASAVDRVLCLLPFEKRFYDQHDVDAVFVGHPLADQLPLTPDQAGARRALGLADDATYVAVLPGSRGSEVRFLGATLFGAACLMQQQDPSLRFIVPAISAARRTEIEAVLKGIGLKATIFDDSRGASVGRDVMAASDVVLLASGTATLEAMLLKRPMVVAYRLHWLTWLIARWLVRIPFVSLPNLLAGRALVPELLQHAATPEAVAKEAIHWLKDNAYREERIGQFFALHQQLQRNASAMSADAVAEVLQSRRQADGA